MLSPTIVKEDDLRTLLESLSHTADEGEQCMARNQIKNMLASCSHEQAEQWLNTAAQARSDHPKITLPKSIDPESLLP